MDTKHIEKLGIFALSTLLTQIEGIDTIIGYNDRTPLYDGEIYIYSGKYLTKEEYLGKVPFQIKSTTYDRRIIDGFEFHFTDLRTYMKGGGVLVLPPFIEDRNKTSYYYKALTPEVLKALIDEKDGQKSTRIIMDSLPVKDKGIREILLQFLDDSKHSLANKYTNYEKLLETNRILQEIVNSLINTCQTPPPPTCP